MTDNDDTHYDYRPRVIGYLCERGHFDFHADPEFDHHCGSKWVGDVTVTPRGPFYPLDEDPADWWPTAVEEAESHLGEQIEAWRNS